MIKVCETHIISIYDLNFSCELEQIMARYDFLEVTDFEQYLN